MTNDENNCATLANERDKVEGMIRSEDWDGLAGLAQILYEKNQKRLSTRVCFASMVNTVFTGYKVLGTQESNISTSRVKRKPSIETFGELMSIFALNDLEVKLLQEKDDEKAQKLLQSLITLGGREFVMSPVYFRNFHKEQNFCDAYEVKGTLLHAAFVYGAPIEVIMRLIEIGRGPLVLSESQCGWNSLHYAVITNASLDVVSKLLELGGKKLILNKNSYGLHLLHFACRPDTYASVDVVKLLVETVGRDVIVQKDATGMNFLHFASAFNAPVPVLCRIIDIGGMRAVLEKTDIGSTPLHSACRKSSISVDVVFKLIKVGGRRLVEESDSHGKIALHYACLSNAPVEVVSKLIEVGGRHTILQEDRTGRNPLHFACQYDASIEIISKLLEIGGKELLVMPDKYGDNAIHHATYQTTEESRDILHLLIQRGGKEMLTHKNEDNETPLCTVIRRLPRYSRRENDTRIRARNTSVLIDRGIAFQIGGEFGIGGLFNLKNKEELCKEWDEIVIPALDQVLAFPRNRNQPILQAAIINKELPFVIKRLVSHFAESVNTTDSLGRYPIDVAIQNKLSWEDGMKEIVEAFTPAGGVPAIGVCARHGVQWESGMKNLLDDSHIDDDNTGSRDESTGLYPFMLAAEGGKYNYDLGSIFHLIKRTPNLVKKWSR